MNREAARQLARIAELVERQQALAGILCEHAERVEARRKGYRAKHWGDDGKRRPRFGTVPPLGPDDPVEVLGDLLEVVYLARKGRGEELVEWDHSFSRPYPVLCTAPDEGKREGLVIVRGGSRYTVNERGIVG